MRSIALFTSTCATDGNISGASDKPARTWSLYSFISFLWALLLMVKVIEPSSFFFNDFNPFALSFSVRSSRASSPINSAGIVTSISKISFSTRIPLDSSVAYDRLSVSSEADTDFAPVATLSSSKATASPRFCHSKTATATAAAATTSTATIPTIKIRVLLLRNCFPPVSLPQRGHVCAPRARLYPHHLQYMIDPPSAGQTAELQK